MFSQPAIPNRPTARVSVGAGRADEHPEVPPEKQDIPGSPERVAEEVSRVSVEGRPAELDAKSGSATLTSQMILAGTILLLASLVLGWVLGYVVGLVTFVLGAAALAFNPVMGAVAMRRADREQVARKHVKGNEQ